MVKSNYNNQLGKLILMLATTSLYSCSSGPPVYTANATISPWSSISQEQVGVAILSASRFYEQWRIEKIRPGKMKGTLSYGQHRATVSIPYDNAHFSIVYENSENFVYDDEDQTIHPRYNYWVKRLEQSIQEEIQYQRQLLQEKESREDNRY